MATVSYRNVSKHFAAGSVALRNFNLEINDGEFVVLVGPSGCGKSTALRVLAGLEEITEGDILINGRVVNQWTPQQRNIAMVFQNYALYPHMNVRSNLEFPLKMLHTPKEHIAQKVAEIAQMLNLTDQLQRKPNQLSGGQRQRVAMGRALVRNPSVFLLDEPLSNLDAKQRAQIRAEIATLQKDLGKTTLYVTHDQVEAMTLGNRVAVLDAGRLHQIGTPAQLYAHPRSTFVARFIGSPGMNIMSTHLQSGENNHWHIEIGGQYLNLQPETIPHHFHLGKRRIYIGFRPESITTKPVGNSFLCQVKVEATEFLGHETLVHFSFLGDKSVTPLIARMPGQFSTGEGKMDFFISIDDLHLFDEKGTAIDRENFSGNVRQSSIMNLL